jgi:hypothetical protein
MNRIIRNIVFIVLSFAFYFAWENGGDRLYGKFVAGGISKITTQFSSMEKAELRHYENPKTDLLYCLYEDRATKIDIEYLLPIVLLLAWQLSLFIDKRVNVKGALKLFAVNFSIVYLLQVLFPLLLYNVSQSKFKSTSLFIGMQVFGFIVFFLIIKDSLLIRFRTSNK